MRFRLLFPVLKWLLALALLGGLLVLAYAFHEIMRDRPVAGGESTQDSKLAGNNVVKLGAELAQSHGLKEEAAQDVEWHERIPVYGRVVPHPRALAEVRAPFAGTLRTAPGSTWPALGSRLEAGDLLGWLDIRVGPQERLDLLSKLKEARARLQGAEEVLKIQQERASRFQALVSPGAVSRADLDQVLVQLSDAQTQLAMAKAAVGQWEKALAEIDRQGDRTDTTWSQPLRTPGGGQITELPGRPGIALEAGSLVAKVVDFRRALVRLDIPVRALAVGPPSEIELFASADTSPALEGANRPASEPSTKPVRGEFIGDLPQVEPSSQFAGYWYEVDTASARDNMATVNHTGQEAAVRQKGSAIWRPGLFVKAFVRIPGGRPRRAVAVPDTALLYHQGRALVYVRLSPGRFERREVQVLGREGGRWVLASGVTPGEPVVSRRAQVLLSEEFRSAADND